jgi:hypothetical protein
MAVCSYVTRTNAMPVLVALLPQPEELNGDEQVTAARMPCTTYAGGPTDMPIWCLCMWAMYLHTALLLPALLSKLSKSWMLSRIWVSWISKHVDAAAGFCMPAVAAVHRVMLCCCVECMS